MKRYEILIIWIVFVAASLSYCMNNMTRTEFLLTIIMEVLVFALVVLCRIKSVLKQIRRYHEKNNVQ